MSAKPKKKWASALVALALGLAFGAGGMLFARSAGVAPDPAERLPVWILAPGALLGMYAALLAHEVGHVLGGLSRGFRFLFLAAGPLWVERAGRGLSVKLNRIAMTWGGVAACVPEDREDLLRRMAVMAAAGPATSVLLAGLAFLGARAAPAGSALGFFLGVTAFASALFFLATAQPFGAGGGFMSDGGRVRALLGGGPRAAREAATLALTAASTAGVRPRDWPVETVRDALAIRDGSALELGGAMLTYQSLLDRGDPDGAAPHLARARELAETSQLARDALATEAAFFEGLVRGDAAAGRAALPEKPGALVEAFQWHRARAAVVLAEGDREGALAEVALAEAALGRTRFQRASEMDRETVATIRARAEAGPGAPGR